MQKAILWIVVAIVIIGGAFLLFGNNSSVAPTPEPTPTPTTPEPAPTPTPTPSAPMSVNVTYDGKVFTPSEVTIKKGGTVTWTSSVNTMQVASGPHPAHTGYDGTARAQHCAAGASNSFDQCAGGKTYSFMFDKVGTWPYHDHANSAKFGKVIVVE